MLKRKTERWIQMPNTQECLVAFIETLPWKHNATEQEKLEARRTAIHELAPKLGVTEESVRRWIARTQKPNGIPLLKLRYLMDDYGNRASEFDVITPEVRSLGAIIARFDVDYKKVAKYIELEQPENLFRVLHGKRGLSKRRRGLARQFITKFIAQEAA